MGGRGAKSSKVTISNKLERIYEPTISKWATEPDGKRLSGYKYNGYTIEIEDNARRYSMFGTERWYRTTLKNGEKVVSDKLREVKEYIEKDIKGEKQMWQIKRNR